ncbi:GNAT family N-acetyltransferase [Bacillus sp. es.034]|uniref:GNAT family N-acetyltransferase n=1 Tax=Bacillus sp. es.034 TaxID=1761763 RepID=UPI000BF979A0|nr:GNAT family N-acetyltransferase [Bacillus sp. es.034]PFG06281.1 putative GNAT superfamily acetyltransferase [Bacillus sp. es.034]
MKNGILSSMNIRKLQSVEELEVVRKLESLIWSFEDSVPVNQSIAVVKNGGFILGAFYQEKLIGFQYSFPGFDGRKVYLVSHSLGIHPDFRKFGIGEILKKAQRSTAIEMGYELITWTYDPLETVNGNLNLHKLGAIVSQYIPNVYGDMDDQLNAGIPTDRFLVKWCIHQSDEKIQSLDDMHPVIELKECDNGWSVDKVYLTLTHDRLSVSVPGHFQELKKTDFSLALDWRKKTRDVFSHYLHQGWIVTDLVKDYKHQGQYLYFLEKGDNRNGN